LTNGYSFTGLTNASFNHEVIDVNDQRIRPGLGFGRPRPGFGFGRPRPGFGLGFLGGLATGALLAPGPGFGYGYPQYAYYPPLPYYPPYPYPYYQDLNYNIPFSPY
jgi:hypothetical protein